MTVQKDAGASCRFTVLPHINVSSYFQLLAGKMMITEDRRRSIAVVRVETRTQQRAEATSAPGRESVQRRVMVRVEPLIKQNNVDNIGIHVLV